MFNFSNTKVLGLQVVIPTDEICIYDEAQYYDNSIKKIDRMRKMVGFYKRRVSDKTTTASDLAIYAANKLIEEMNIDKNTIDALVFVVQQPDYVAPATAYFIHQKLGLSDKCIATDINQGCAGWVFGLFMASQMIESRTFKRVLLLNADTPSVGINPADRNNAPIFSDGGVATLLEYSENEVKSYYNIRTKSGGFESIIAPASGRRFRFDINDDKDFDMISKLRKKEIINKTTGNAQFFFGGYMNGMDVFDFTMNVVPQNINELIDFAKIEKEDIPYLCLHQANKQIVQTIATSTGFELEKVPYEAFENYGNNTMCSIPTTISLLPKEKSKKNLCCSGFGNGLVCTSTILNLENTHICEIKDFEKPEYVKTRDEYIKYWIEKMEG